MLQSSEYILNVENVAKSFSGVKALHMVNFRVNEGCIKALIGPNGAGKTTLLNIINGLLRPDVGQIVFKGRELTKLKPQNIALLGLARTFQLVRLFSVNNATVLDNVVVGAHSKLKPGIVKSLFFKNKSNKAIAAVRKNALKILEFVGLRDFAYSSPLALSFGNQRMLELARSLMTGPELLLLDEPASGLNAEEVENFIKLLLSIRSQGVTILIVEHNMDLVMKVADDIVVLDFGQKIAEGNPSEIVNNSRVITAYLGEDYIGNGI
jgi:ABC-type branched-subunit amino acid transport system ATPase component